MLGSVPARRTLPTSKAVPRAVCKTAQLRAKSFDLAVTLWAPARLTSCISHPGLAEAYEPLRSTLCPARAPFHHLAAPESTRKPLLHTRGISRKTTRRLELAIDFSHGVWPHPPAPPPGKRAKTQPMGMQEKF